MGKIQKKAGEHMNTKLQISGLTFSYKERKILNEMDFRVKEGEFVSLHPNTYLVHWYSADHDLDGYLDLDCYFSIGPDVIWNPAVQRVARQVPENRILLETDGMDTVKWAWEEGQKNQNYAIKEQESIRETTQKQPEEIVVKDSLHATARMAAKLRNSSPEILISLTTDNFLTFFGNSY